MRALAIAMLACAAACSVQSAADAGPDAGADAGVDASTDLGLDLPGPDYGTPPDPGDAGPTACGAADAGAACPVQDATAARCGARGAAYFDGTRCAEATHDDCDAGAALGAFDGLWQCASTCAAAGKCDASRLSVLGTPWTPAMPPVYCGILWLCESAPALVWRSAPLCDVPWLSCTDPRGYASAQPQPSCGVLGDACAVDRSFDPRSSPDDLRDVCALSLLPWVTSVECIFPPD